MAEAFFIAKEKTMQQNNRKTQPDFKPQPYKFTDVPLEKRYAIWYAIEQARESARQRGDYGRANVLAMLEQCLLGYKPFNALQFFNVLSNSVTLPDARWMHEQVKQRRARSNAIHKARREYERRVSFLAE